MSNSENDTTSYLSKCEILSDLWLSYRSDEEFQEFIKFNDLGLPLAYAITEDIVESSEEAQRFIEETFQLFLGYLKIEDSGFESLYDILAARTED